MRLSSIFIVAILLFSCAEPVHEPDGFITSAGGEESISEDTLASDASAYDLEKQPEIVQQFFALKDEQIGDDYCFDRSAVENLLMGEGIDEYTWTSKKINSNYLRFENSECFVTTEFQIIKGGFNAIAVLFQSSKNGQQRDFYWWYEEAMRWEEVLEMPQLQMTDFYYALEDEEQAWVRDFGEYYGYINEQTGQISYHFSTWQMGLNADGKEIMDFNKDPDYSYLLNYNEEAGFWLQRVYENESLIPKRYFLAYSETGVISEDFKSLYESIQSQLKDEYQIESALADFTQTNYKAHFESDTIDFSAMQQFEPRNGFWFFEEGKEPLDVEMGEVVPTVNKAKNYFDQF